MTIRKRDAPGSFDPIAVEAMGKAFEGLVTHLQIKDNDPSMEVIAQAVINDAAAGARDPEEIKMRALHVFFFQQRQVA